MESIDNIKTVRSLTMEKSVIDRFIEMTQVSHNANKKKAKVQVRYFIRRLTNDEFGVFSIIQPQFRL